VMLREWLTALGEASVEEVLFKIISIWPLNVSNHKYKRGRTTWHFQDNTRHPLRLVSCTGGGSVATGKMLLLGAAGAGAEGAAGAGGIGFCAAGGFG
jgi:hypothetical protein